MTPYREEKSTMSNMTTVAQRLTGQVAHLPVDPDDDEPYRPPPPPHQPGDAPPEPPQGDPPPQTPPERVATAAR
jgi:hypothetical protein